MAIRVEFRKEVGESYSPSRSMLREYELTYVVCDEPDLVRLRSNVRKDSVYLYQVQATPEHGWQLFCAMLERANALRPTPELYHTLLSSSTTNIVAYVTSQR